LICYRHRHGGLSVYGSSARLDVARRVFLEITGVNWLVPLEGESSHSLSFWYPRHNLLHWWGNVDRCCQLQTAIFDQVDGTGSPLVLTKELLQPLF